MLIWGLLHKTITGEELRLFLPEFFSYGKVIGKNHANLSFQILPEFFFGKSFIQWASDGLMSLELSWFALSLNSGLNNSTSSLTYLLPSAFCVMEMLFL